ncbi:hypothetical protein JCM6292_2531 [Bacteroides pyogenes JCM 6292]|uniref:Uncharacterized protein n=2 Tax=Bacteroides pyogenes TaxID=310300 RepID=W4PGQ3_9BACE|nr:hypothetical protein JCM6292_2531 [Bacteroides pyogenes JCM 6292]GAE18880.1 hypothetical protein JCM6294_1841 [Bacteroides pyogenes DSM 20611 = JCM 6294]
MREQRLCFISEEPFSDFFAGSVCPSRYREKIRRKCLLAGCCEKSGAIKKAYKAILKKNCEQKIF